MLKLRLLPLILLLMSLSILPTRAQTPAAPELQIIRFSWKQYQPDRLGMETGMAKAGDRNAPPPTRDDARLEVLRSQSAENSKQVIAEMENQKQQRQIQEKAQIHTDTKPAPGSSYQYSLEVKNTSPKQVVELQWDYVFTDQRTLQKAFRYHFASRAKIKPGKSAKLTVYSTATPYAVVNAKSSRAQENERIVIKRIAYVDGSVWESQ